MSTNASSKNSIRLPHPDVELCTIDRIEQLTHVRTAEPPAEISRRRWIEYQLRSDRVEERFVIATPLDVFEASPLHKTFIAGFNTWPDSSYEPRYFRIGLAMLKDEFS